MQRAPSDLLETLWSFARTRYGRHPQGRSELEAWQQRRVLAHLRHVLPRSPYTNERFRGVDHDLTRWREIASIGKTELMDNFSRLNTEGVDRDEALALALAADRSRDFVPKLHGLTVGLSSGTSGHRGLFLSSQSENNQWSGVALAKLLPGAPWQQNRIALLHRANSHLYQGLGSGRLQFRYFDLLQPWEALVTQLSDYQPTVLIAPPSALRLWADQSERTAGARALTLPLRRVVSVAEVLEPLDRRHIERALGVRVDSAYVANEGFVASSCGHGSLHLNEDLMVIEKDWLDREQNTFVPILTDFRRRVVPIVRYRLDDVLTLARRPCSCGSPHETIASIQGRCDDVFELGGVVVFPDFIRQALMQSSGEIRAYRAVQNSEDRIEVTITLDDPALARCAAIAHEVEANLQRVLDKLGAPASKITVQVQHAEALPLTVHKVRRVVRAPSES
jgi:putative adenylate-forming enzyme